MTTGAGRPRKDGIAAHRGEAITQDGNTEKPGDKNSHAPVKVDLELFDSPAGGPPPMPAEGESPPAKSED